MKGDVVVTDRAWAEPSFAISPTVSQLIRVVRLESLGLQLDQEDRAQGWDQVLTDECSYPSAGLGATLGQT